MEGFVNCYDDKGAGIWMFFGFFLLGSRSVFSTSVGGVLRYTSRPQFPEDFEA